VNQALQALQEAGVIRVEYGGVRVIDLEGLRRYRPQLRRDAAAPRPVASVRPDLQAPGAPSLSR
jgi:hypothetical protein